MIAIRELRVLLRKASVECLEESRKDPGHKCQSAQALAGLFHRTKPGARFTRFEHQNTRYITSCSGRIPLFAAMPMKVGASTLCLFSVTRRIDLLTTCRTRWQYDHPGRGPHFLRCDQEVARRWASDFQSLRIVG